MTTEFILVLYFILACCEAFFWRVVIHLLANLSIQAVEIAWTLHRIFSVQAALVEEAEESNTETISIKSDSTAASTELPRFQIDLQNSHLILEKTGYPSESRVRLCSNSSSS